MPVHRILNGFHIAAAKGTEIEENVEETNAIETWTILLTERTTGDTYRISFRRDTRDELVRQLTGGIVLAGGELPRI